LNRSKIRTMQSIIRYKQAYRTDFKKNMLDTYTIGKDGVKVTFPFKGYTYREVKDGRLIASHQVVIHTEKALMDVW